MSDEPKNEMKEDGKEDDGMTTKMKNGALVINYCDDGAERRDGGRGFAWNSFHACASDSRLDGPAFLKSSLQTALASFHITWEGCQQPCAATRFYRGKEGARVGGQVQHALWVEKQGAEAAERVDAGSAEGKMRRSASNPATAVKGGVLACPEREWYAAMPFE
ncbi:hypothetical protein PAPYR_11702 [Paratrimastix pyriformis]|uniref:Uncharacterized protein n=1 Tax=Paratrimastix pyriformis TaxID=342808 RepID=A0ABQ8U397_9EUKA|nr:hypothetical protein PAPYR_11702 [Paratrimastix pyriformis]